MGQYGAEVAHRAAGYEQSGFLARSRGRQRLQFIHRGVFAVDVVTDGGCGHRLTHGGRRPTNGVGAKINSIHAR